jgi:hypothetical protein
MALPTLACATALPRDSISGGYEKKGGSIRHLKPLCDQNELVCASVVACSQSMRHLISRKVFNDAKGKVQMDSTNFILFEA